MNLSIQQSKNSPSTLCIYNGANIKFAHYDMEKDRVSILNNPIAKQLEKVNGTDLLKEAVKNEVKLWQYNNSPFRKLDKETVSKFTNTLLAMGILGAALDTAEQELKPILKMINADLGDISNLKEYLNRFMKSSAKVLGQDLAIQSFDKGEEVYNQSMEYAKSLNV